MRKEICTKYADELAAFDEYTSKRPAPLDKKEQTALLDLLDLQPPPIDSKTEKSANTRLNKESYTALVTAVEKTLTDIRHSSVDKTRYETILIAKYTYLYRLIVDVNQQVRSQLLKPKISELVELNADQQQLLYDRLLHFNVSLPIFISSIDVDPIEFKNSARYLIIELLNTKIKKFRDNDNKSFAHEWLANMENNFGELIEMEGRNNAEQLERVFALKRENRATGEMLPTIRLELELDIAAIEASACLDDDDDSDSDCPVNYNSANNTNLTETCRVPAEKTYPEFFTTPRTPHQSQLLMQKNSDNIFDCTK